MVKRLQVFHFAQPYGICVGCGHKFIPVAALGSAWRDQVKAQFDAHKCKSLDSSQNALRVVKQATDDHG
jgi:hypothetical protein